MNDRTLVGPWIRRFLLEHLVAERNLARNTQASYRDTLTLLLPFAKERTKIPIDRLAIEDLSSDIIIQFLKHIETTRRCSGVTRNQRLGAIHSLAKFVGMRSPQHIAWCTAIRAVPFKKVTRAVMDYLEKAEVDAMLAVPDRRTERGTRDYAILLFLYNSGARADEAAQLTIGDLTLGTSAPCVRILGKGRKVRVCPLWKVTIQSLSSLIGSRPDAEHVFIGNRNRPLTRYGIYKLVKSTVAEARHSEPSLLKKRVSPHTLRHSTAVHLLRAGVDINTIRAWLGHVSVDTTNIYAEVDIEMKAKALNRCDISSKEAHRHWKSQPQLMAFLKGL
jgi:site-specific recombinase XerD